MHFKDDPISDMHAKNYLIILCLMPLPGPSKFGPAFWSRLFRRGPVEYNYPEIRRVTPACTGRQINKKVSSLPCKLFDICRVSCVTNRYVISFYC